MNVFYPVFFSYFYPHPHFLTPHPPLPRLSQGLILGNACYAFVALQFESHSTCQSSGTSQLNWDRTVLLPLHR